ncbi:MAG TPA: ABC transporter ATP-binding protein [Acidimicrobiales bacterium]|jgi:simple sugar transport system ATP-binding protein|nr:ABC transporter ATP-binding protein [Acidimicrobiales bacterium]
MDGTAKPATPALAAETRGITKAFGGVLALDHVDLDLRVGEVHALLGENGAGKTTLSNILSGIYRADSGVVMVDGTARPFRSPADAIAAGIGMVHQHFRLVPPMTVAENIHLGWDSTPTIVNQRDLAARTQRLADEIGLRVDPRAPVWQLSVGEQQRVEILRVLARGARVLILDEPTAVLTTVEARELFVVIRSLVEGGRTVVFISHKLNEVLEIADRITVLRNGRKIVTRDREGVTARELARLMTGEARDLAVEHRVIDTSQPVLTLESVSARGASGLVSLHDVSVTVHAGEVVGIAGVSGNGQTELVEVMTGLRRVDRGHITVAGMDVTNRSPRRFASAGIGYIPEDRLGVGLVRTAPVRDNAVLRHYRTAELAGPVTLKRGAITRFAQRLVDAGRVQTRSIDAPAGHMSGGNQQRLIAQREALLAERVFVAAQPTRGLDVLATQEVQTSLLARRDAGCAVVLVSDDLDEVMLLSDRIAVMYEGRIVGVFDRHAADRERIGLLMGGHVSDGAGT